MSADLSTASGQSRVRTLRAAQEFLHRLWPGRSAPDSMWLAYHQKAAELYSAVAEIDQAHHHEALCWAQQERDAAQLIAKLVTPAPASDTAVPASPEVGRRRSRSPRPAVR